MGIFPTIFRESKNWIDENPNYVSVLCAITSVIGCGIIVPQVMPALTLVFKAKIGLGLVGLGVTGIGVNVVNIVVNEAMPTPKTEEETVLYKKLCAEEAALKALEKQNISSLSAKEKIELQYELQEQEGRVQAMKNKIRSTHKLNQKILNEVQFDQNSAAVEPEKENVVEDQAVSVSEESLPSYDTSIKAEKEIIPVVISDYQPSEDENTSDMFGESSTIEEEL
ncbi:MAG: hypothetical protein DGJ47_001020 [Rickettsiaceae bacterium]